MKCPHCHRDIREAIVLSAAASIMGKRSARSAPLTAEKARAMQLGSARARVRNRATKSGGPSAGAMPRGSGESPCAT